MRARVSASASALRDIQPILGDNIPVASSTSMPTNPAISSMSASSSIMFVAGSYSTYLNPTCEFSCPNDSVCATVLRMVLSLVLGNSFSIQPSNSVGFTMLQPPPRRRSGRSCITMSFQNLRLGLPSAAFTNSCRMGSSSFVHQPMLYFSNACVFSTTLRQSAGVPSSVMDGMPHVAAKSVKRKYCFTASISVTCEAIRSVIPVVEKSAVIVWARSPFVCAAISFENRRITSFQLAFGWCRRSNVGSSARLVLMTKSFTPSWLTNSERISSEWLLTYSLKVRQISSHSISGDSLTGRWSAYASVSVE